MSGLSNWDIWQILRNCFCFLSTWWVDQRLICPWFSASQFSDGSVVAVCVLPVCVTSAGLWFLASSDLIIPSVCCVSSSSPLPGTKTMRCSSIGHASTPNTISVISPFPLYPSLTLSLSVSLSQYCITPPPYTDCGPCLIYHGLCGAWVVFWLNTTCICAEHSKAVLFCQPLMDTIFGKKHKWAPGYFKEVMRF